VRPPKGNMGLRKKAIEREQWIYEKK
jgi:hypothetical protein